MTPELRKKATLFSSFIFFLLGGIEYAVILPTLNEYVETFTEETFYLGLILASFSLSGLLVAPIFGVFHDKLRKTKAMLLFANLFEIVGNFLYFMNISVKMLVLSRFVAGIGAGVGASMLAQIARTTTEKERSAAFALFMAARQFGLIFGPALNLVLEQLDFYIGPYVCNKLTAPGLFMAIVWAVFEVVVIFLYFDLPFLADLPIDVRKDVEERGRGTMTSPPEEDEGIHTARPLTPRELTNVLGGEEEEDDEEDDGESTPILRNGYGSVQQIQKKPMKLTRKQKIKALLREEIVVMLAATFIFFFNQTALETCMTPLTKQFLNLESLGNSLLYCLAGGEIIVGFALIKILSKRVQDRVILTIGLLIEIGSLIVFCIFLPLATHRPEWTGKITNWVWLTFVFVVQVSGLPFILVANVSLLSKLVPEEIQGLSQGVRRSIMGIGTIMGPLWGTGAVSVPIAFSPVMVILFSIVQGMVFLSWNKLAEPGHASMQNRPRLTSGTTYETNDERSPLLNEKDRQY